MIFSVQFYCSQCTDTGLCRQCQSRAVSGRAVFCEECRLSNKREAARACAKRRRQRERDAQITLTLMLKKPPVLLLDASDEEIIPVSAPKQCTCTQPLNRRRCVACRLSYCDKCKAFVHPKCSVLLSAQSAALSLGEMRLAA